MKTRVVSQDFLRWLDEFVTSIEGVERPSELGIKRSEYEHGYKVGAANTQKVIGFKLRYAIEAEKRRIARLDSGADRV